MFTVLPPLKLIESSLRKRLEALGTPEITKIMFTVSKTHTESPPTYYYYYSTIPWGNTTLLSLGERLEALGTPEITKIMFTVVQLLKLIDSPLQQVITTALLSLGEILLYYPLGKRLEALGTSDIT